MDLPTLRGVLEKRGINAIGPALGPDTDDDVISALLSETGPADRSLRIALKNVLQQRLGRESSAYQQASFGLLAAHVREGKRAFASELVGGNESATLNDDVIAARIDAQDGAERVAAAQVMRPRHLPLLEARLATEPEGETREKLAEAGRRIAGEPGAPPTPLISAEDRLTAMARRFGRAKGWLRWATAADSLGADPAALRACVTGASAIFAAHPEGFYAAEGRRPPAPDAFDARLTSLTVSAALPQTKLPKKLSGKTFATLAETWLRAQTALWLPELRYWLGIPELAEGLEGVRLAGPGGLGSIAAGQVTSSFDDNAFVRVAHPSQVSAGDWSGDEPNWQTDRPAFTRGDMPALGPDAPSVPHADWLKRCRALGYAPIREQRAVVTSVRWIGDVRLSHSGYGKGYGDKSDQRLREVSYPQPADPRLSEVIVSEVVWDVRRLLGVDPLKRR